MLVVLENRRSSQGGVRTPCTLPLDPPLLYNVLFFFGRAVHTLTFVSTSLQWPVSFFPQGGRCRKVQLYLQDSVFMVVIMM